MTPFEALEFLGLCLSVESGHDKGLVSLEQRIADRNVDWPAVVSIADRHFLLPLLHSSLKAKNLDALLPHDLRDTLSTLYHLNLRRNERLKLQLNQVLRWLNAAGVVPVLLKGAAVLFSDLYPDPACRMMFDLDLLVPKAQLSVCADRLQEAGYGPMADADTPGWHHHAPPLAHPDHLARIKLHHELFVKPYTHLLDADTVLKEAILVDEKGVQFRLGTAFHGAMLNIGQHQLGDKLYYMRTFLLDKLYDMVRLMHAPGRDDLWEKLFSRFEAAGYKRAAAAYFMLIRRIFRHPIPPGIRPPSHANLEWRLIKALWDPHPAIAYYQNIGADIFQHPDRARAFLSRLISPKSFKDHFRRVSARMGGR